MPTVGQFEVDHIIASAVWGDYAAGRIRGLPPRVDRHGPQHLSNFAWTCRYCNLAKRDQVVHRSSRHVYALLDPRYDRWTDHFRFLHRYLFIIGVTDIGMATETALGFNDRGVDGPLGTRHDAIVTGTYPPPWARPWIDWMEAPHS